jgi:23S rRNA pseudouridine1911/1915/1917 synthase
MQASVAPSSRAQWTVSDADRDSRLDRFLAVPDRLGSRSRAVAALERGRVFLNDVEVNGNAAATRLGRGDVVRVWMDRPGSAKRRGPIAVGDLQILHEDASLVVVNNPAGLLTVPLEDCEGPPSVQDQLVVHLRSHGKRRPLVVHRIDRDTSGLVLFAKDTRAQEHLKAQFRRREPTRVYLALVYGHPDPAAGVWRDTLVWDERASIQKATHPDDPRGTEAVCEYRTVEAFTDTAIIDVRLNTGKRNQIRIQSRLRGHTLVGERRYVFGPDTIRPIDFPRHALHAHRLAFRHPADERPLSFDAPPPADLEKLFRRLRAASRTKAR